MNCEICGNELSPARIAALDNLRRPFLSKDPIDVPDLCVPCAETEVRPVRAARYSADESGVGFQIISGSIEESHYSYWGSRLHDSEGSL